VIVKIDGVLAMAVLPASRHIDVSALKSATGAPTVEIASEPEFSGRFPGCDTGAMPPFGNLYGMSVFADESLTKDKEIAFNAGTHNEVIRLSYADFEALVKPTVLNFAYRGAGTSAA
jgi:Ala-tRNA(Pro) deacylase